MRLWCQVAQPRWLLITCPAGSTDWVLPVLFFTSYPGLEHVWQEYTVSTILVFLWMHVVVQDLKNCDSNQGFSRWIAVVSLPTPLQISLRVYPVVIGWIKVALQKSQLHTPSGKSNCNLPHSFLLSIPLSPLIRFWPLRETFYMEPFINKCLDSFCSLIKPYKTVGILPILFLCSISYFGCKRGAFSIYPFCKLLQEMELSL